MIISQLLKFQIFNNKKLLFNSIYQKVKQLTRLNKIFYLIKFNKRLLLNKDLRKKQIKNSFLDII